MELTLEKIAADIADMLSEAASSRHSPMHTPVVSTNDGDMRIMVLRAFNAQAKTLRFHTDLRSPKVARIGEGSSVGVLFYDREKKVQIRCRGTGRIEHDTSLAQTAWEESTPFARRCYLGSAPGELRDAPSSGLPKEIEGLQPSEDDLIPARPNFAVLSVKIESMDWYHLSNDGHRRALFEGDRSQWLTP